VAAAMAGSGVTGRVAHRRETRGARGDFGRGAAMLRGGAAFGQGATAGAAGGVGWGGRAPLRQAVNRLSSAATSWRRASQSRIASDRLPPACRAQATRVLRWPDTIWASGFLTINVF